MFSFDPDWKSLAGIQAMEPTLVFSEEPAFNLWAILKDPAKANQFTLLFLVVPLSHGYILSLGGRRLHKYQMIFPHKYASSTSQFLIHENIVATLR